MLAAAWLDSTLTIQTRRRFMSTMPASSEELRDKYAVMANMWLLAAMRPPGRALYQDLTPNTWNEFLQAFLSTRNFRLEREIQGIKMVVLAWASVLGTRTNCEKRLFASYEPRGFPSRPHSGPLAGQKRVAWNIGSPCCRSQTRTCPGLQVPAPMSAAWKSVSQIWKRPRTPINEDVQRLHAEKITARRRHRRRAAWERRSLCEGAGHKSGADDVQ